MLNNSTHKIKERFLECLQNGPMTYAALREKVRSKYKMADVLFIRDSLLKDGFIKEVDSYKLKDGRTMQLFGLTEKRLENPKNDFWEDGSPKSRGNAFDWRSTSIGIYTRQELVNIESGRRFGAKGSRNSINVYSKA